ncbi:hypothetical protein EVA_07280 [gut metagenome]|uniref:Uncharacterized protein n=1 Tax=gut metagenome TaxID=749906 RepID=J9CWK1_9ZZZZ
MVVHSYHCKYGPNFLHVYPCTFGILLEQFLHCFIKCH